MVIGKLHKIANFLSQNACVDEPLSLIKIWNENKKSKTAYFFCNFNPFFEGDWSIFKKGQSRPLFVYFHSFLVTISIQIEKSVDGVLGIRTQGLRMVDSDKTTELWRPPNWSLQWEFSNILSSNDDRLSTLLCSFRKVIMAQNEK